MVNTAAWWESLVFKKYFLTNSGKRKAKGKGASVVVATKEEKKQKSSFILPTESSYHSSNTWSPQKHLLRCSRTAQNISWWPHCCSVFSRLSELTLALLINPYTWHDIYITKRQIWLQCSHRCRVGKKQPAWARSVKSDFRISGTACEQLSTAQNTKRTCVTTCYFRTILHFYLRHNAGQPHLVYTTCPLLPAAASSVSQGFSCISTDLLERARGVMQGWWG